MAAIYGTEASYGQVKKVCVRAETGGGGDGREGRIRAMDTHTR